MRYSMKKMVEEFRDPSSHWRGKPFWAWNGDLKEEELKRQIELFDQMGMGGYFMHSRTGLQTEYLGEEWFSLINASVDKGLEVGIESWIYDEDRWPSGTCGGLISENPDYQAKFLKLDILSPADERITEDTVAFYAAEIRGLDCYQDWRISEDEEVRMTASHGGEVVVLRFYIEKEVPSSFYNGNTWIDALKREVTDAYIESTHQRYYDACGERFGKGVYGVFTDEPNRGTLFDTFNLKNDRPEYMGPWTETLFDDFEEAFGCRLEEHLPELYFRIDGERINPVKWQYVELLQRLFLKNYAQPIHKWCLDHDLILTGHILHEDTLAAQTAVSGSMMRYYEHMDYPGVDILGEANRNYHVVKQLASACRQLNKPMLLSELYGGTGWQMNFKSHKWVGDWQTLLGINLRCHHLSWYTMEGEAKRDYPGSISCQSAWYPDYQLVESYFARFGMLMTQGRPECDLLVLNPVESLWASIYPGCSKVLSSQDPVNQQIEAEYQILLHWLLGSRIDYDYGDEGLMEEYGSVQRDADGTPILSIGKMSYRTVIISSMKTIRSTTLRLIDEFREAGGQVVLLGEAPAYVDARRSEDALTFSQKVTALPFEKQPLIDLVSKDHGAPVSCTIGDEPAPEDIFMQVRNTEEGYLIGIINLNKDISYPEVKLSFPAGCRVEEFDLLSGEITEVKLITEGDDAPYTIVPMYAVGSRAYALIRDAVAVSAEKGTEPTCTIIRNDDDLSYSLTEPNVCVLDYADLTIEGNDTRSGDILKLDAVLRESLGMAARAGDMIQPWLQKKLDADREDPVHRIRITYPVNMLEGAPSPEILCIERPESCRSLQVNGKVIELTEEGMWVDIAFRKIRIPEGTFSAGKNEITLEIDYDSCHGLEAVYLLGSFGVIAEDAVPTISKLPEMLRTESVISQGLPFYSDRIQYRLTVPEACRETSEEVRLQTPSFEGALVKLRDTQGRLIGDMPWEPYELAIPKEILSQDEQIIVEVVLTRRNTFGPLHNLPLYAPGYGPDNYVSTGDNWSDSPVLYPAGLLDAPQWVISEKH